MTSWERELLVVLANYVRMLSLSQAARIWWTADRRGLRRARESVGRLAAGGWLDSYQVFSRPVAPLSKPAAIWTINQRLPDFPKLSAWLHRRASASAAVTTVITATKKTHTLFGRGVVPRRPKLTQITHDLHVAEVFLAYCARGFDVRQRWVLEDYFPDTWPIREQPDAILLDEQGKFARAVEYGGDYSVERLEKLHHALARIWLPYEIW
jgi:hypothetical protein